MSTWTWSYLGFDSVDAGTRQVFLNDFTQVNFCLESLRNCLVYALCRFGVSSRGHILSLWPRSLRLFVGLFSLMETRHHGTFLMLLPFKRALSDFVKHKSSKMAGPPALYDPQCWSIYIRDATFLQPSCFLRYGTQQRDYIIRRRMILGV